MVQAGGQMSNRPNLLMLNWPLQGLVAFQGFALRWPRSFFENIAVVSNETLVSSLSQAALTCPWISLTQFSTCDLHPSNRIPMFQGPTWWSLPWLPIGRSLTSRPSWWCSPSRPLWCDSPPSPPCLTKLPLRERVIKRRTSLGPMEEFDWGD